MPWTSRQSPGLEERQVCVAFCRVWDGTEETPEMTGQRTLDLKKGYKGLETFEISSDLLFMLLAAYL